MGLQQSLRGVDGNADPVDLFRNRARARDRDRLELKNENIF